MDKVRTSFGGIVVGVSPKHPSQIKGDFGTFIDEHCWWIDSSGYLRVPQNVGTHYYLGWNTGS